MRFSETLAASCGISLVIIFSSAFLIFRSFVCKNGLLVYGRSFAETLLTGGDLSHIWYRTEIK